MNNENLKPFSERTESEQRKIRSKGGKKSGEVRRAKKTMRELLDYLLEKEITNNKGEKATTKEAILVAAIKKAIAGDMKAIEFIRDTVGENPRFIVDNNVIMQTSTKDAFLQHLKDMAKNAD